jgi:inorganic pyrophosphatase
MDHFFTGFVDELTKTAAKGSVRAALSRIPPGAKSALKSMGLWSAVDYGLAPEKGVAHGLRSGVGFVGGDILAGKLLGGAGGSGLKGKGLRFGGRMLGGMLGAQILHNMARKKQGDYDRARAEKTAAAVPKSHLTPDSSNVKGFSYDPSTKQLSVTYKGGGTYRYNDVPPATFRSLRRNKSAGKTVNRLVKGPGYDYEKVANDPVKETVNIHGIPIALEWRKGEMRKYFNHDPLKSRSVGKIDYNQKMHADYGYVKGVIDADGEELDVYLGPNRESEKVYVLEKLRRTDGSFDENKIMLGYDSLKEARASYLQHQGNDELGKVYELTLQLFKQKFLRKNKFKKHGSGDSNEALRLAAKKQGPGRLLTEAECRARAKLELAKHANGDMLAYFAAHPAKAKEKRARDVVRLKKRRAAGKYLTDNQRSLLKKEGSPKHPTAQERFYTGEQKKKKANELLKKAGFLRERVREGNSTELIGQLRKKRRQIEKMAGVCVRTLTWGGLTMKFEYLKGDTRSGTGEGGKKWSRKMKDCYGYIPGTYGKGADGEAIDVYFNPEALDGPVFKIRQLTKEGKYDEDKFMVGYGSAAAARSAFARNMPKWAFGDMTSMTMKSFRTLVGQEGSKVRVPSDGNAERERVRRAMERKSA